MAQARVKGYVVGYDEKSCELVWTVKVNDPSSVHNGKKFPVHSLHAGTMISKPSVDVSFKVEPVQVGQEKILKATDVAIGVVLPADCKIGNSRNGGTINIVVSTFQGKFHVWLTGMESEKEVIDTCEEYQPGGEGKFIALVKVPLSVGDDFDSVLSKDELETGLEALSTLAYVEPIRDAIEYIFSYVFETANKQKGTAE